MPFDALCKLMRSEILTESIRHDLNRIALLEDAMAEHDKELAEMQERMLKRTKQRLVESGKSPDEAERIAYAALHAPSKYKLPTIDELDG